MKRRTLFGVLLVLLLVLTLAPAVLASHPGEPVGACAPVFTLHHVGMHAHDDHDNHMHQHVGLDYDLNGDGYWCVKHVGVDGSNHVHVDNSLPLY